MTAMAILTVTMGAGVTWMGCCCPPDHDRADNDAYGDGGDDDVLGRPLF